MDNLTLCSIPIRHPLFSIQPLLFLLRHLPRSLAQCLQQTPTSGSRSPLLPMLFQTAAFRLERSRLTMAELQSAVHKPNPSPERDAAMATGERLLFKSHDPAKSVDEFKKVIKIDPWYGQGYMLLGLGF